MHQIEHLAEDSDRDTQEIVEAMRKSGSYALLQEEISRSQALDFLVENAVAVPLPEDEQPGADEEEPETGEASVEAKVEAGATQTENDEREER
jgi:trigger factor